MEIEKSAGRPKLPEGEAKSSVVRARVTPEEKVRMARSAKNCKMTLADWVRKTLLDAS